jgi:hypothetical protein
VSASDAATLRAVADELDALALDAARFAGTLEHTSRGWSEWFGRSAAYRRAADLVRERLRAAGAARPT